MKQIFQARLVQRGPNGAWTYLKVPFNVEATFGSRGRVPVAGEINGFAFRNSLMPEGDGSHAMMVSKALQAGARAAQGELVSVVMDLDTEARCVVVPEALLEALATNADARTAFDRLAPSHRREFADWVAGAKREETRTDRARRSVAMIIARKHVK